MTSGGNTDNVEHRHSVIKRRMEEFQCTYCPPHGGENEGIHGKRHGVWRNRKFIKSKRKEVK